MPESPDSHRPRGDSIPDAIAAVLVVLILTAMAVHFVSG